MYKFFILLLLLGFTAQSQELIGKIEGGEVFEAKEHYELIFKNKANNKYAYTYLTKNGKKENAYTVLKKFVFSLFNNPTKESFLLQLEDDSLYLVYKEDKVRMEIWTNHDSNKRKSSKWYTFIEYTQLFGLAPKKNSF